MEKLNNETFFNNLNMEKLNNETFSGEDLDTKFNETRKFYKEKVLQIITEIQKRIDDKDYGTRYISIMDMLFNLPVKDLEQTEGEKDTWVLCINEQNSQIYCSLPICTEDDLRYKDIVEKNRKYLLTHFGSYFDEEDFEGYMKRAWEYICNDTPIPTQQLYNEYLLPTGGNKNSAQWMATTVTKLITNMREVRNRVLCCKYLLAKNKMNKQKDKKQSKKQAKILKKQAEINEKRKKALNQLLKKMQKKIEQECQSNYFRKWKDNIRKEKLATYDWKKFAECIANIKDRNKQQKLIEAKQGSNKAFYKLQNNAVLLKKQDEFTEKLTKTKNKLKTSVLKGVVNNKINSEKNIMSKTFHNWYSNTLKQNNETLKQSNRDLQIRVNNLNKEYTLVNDANNKHKEEFEKKIADAKQELNQLTNKKNQEIEDLKLQHEKEKKYIIEQCNKEAEHLFSEYVQGIGKKISTYINNKIMPEYRFYQNNFLDSNIYKNRYLAMYNEKMELENKYTKLLKQNNQLKDKIEQLKPELNIKAEEFIPKKNKTNANMQFNNNNYINYNNLLNTMKYFYPNQAFGKEKNMQLNNHNHINYNNLNTMKYFYPNQAFGGFVNGKK